MALFTAHINTGHAVDFVDVHAGGGRVRIERFARALDRFREKIVKRSQDIAALGVMAVLEFVELFFVTA